MIIVVFFAPSTGTILQCAAAPRAWIEADGRAFVEVHEYRPDWDITHRVENGAVVAIA